MGVFIRHTSGPECPLDVTCELLKQSIVSIPLWAAMTEHPFAGRQSMRGLAATTNRGCRDADTDGHNHQKRGRQQGKSLRDQW